MKRYNFTKDGGRFAHTGKEADRDMWKVPTLRNIELTAPYFHNGAETADLVAFLGALSGPFPQQPLPQLPPAAGRSIVIYDSCRF